MVGHPPSEDGAQKPSTGPNLFRTRHGETARRVEEIREFVFGPDGRTPKAERWVRRTTIERDPKAGLVASAVGAVFTFAVQVVLATAVVAMSLVILATWSGWTAGIFAAASIGAVFGLPVLVDHAPAEAREAIATFATLLVTVVSLFYLGTVSFGVAGGLAAAALAVPLVLWFL